MEKHSSPADYFPKMHITGQFSELDGRMDPDFHIAKAAMEPRMKQLERLGQEQVLDLARNMVSELDAGQRGQILGVLRATKQKGSMGTFEANTLVNNYPSMSLALMEGFLQEAKQAAHCELERAKTRLRTLQGLEAQLRKAAQDDTHLDKSKPEQGVRLAVKQRTR